MMHTIGAQKNEQHNLQSEDIQYVCEQIKISINNMLKETKTSNEEERFEKLHKLNELKQLLSTIEDINHSVNTLLSQQLQKRSPEIH